MRIKGSSYLWLEDHCTLSQWCRFWVIERQRKRKWSSLLERKFDVERVFIFTSFINNPSSSRALLFLFFLNTIIMIRSIDIWIHFQSYLKLNLMMNNSIFNLILKCNHYNLIQNNSTKFQNINIFEKNLKYTKII